MAMASNYPNRPPYIPQSHFRSGAPSAAKGKPSDPTQVGKLIQSFDNFNPTMRLSIQVLDANQHALKAFCMKSQGSINDSVIELAEAAKGAAMKCNTVAQKDFFNTLIHTLGTIKTDASRLVRGAIYEGLNHIGSEVDPKELAIAKQQNADKISQLSIKQKNVFETWSPVTTTAKMSKPRSTKPTGPKGIEIDLNKELNGIATDCSRSGPKATMYVANDACRQIFNTTIVRAEENKRPDKAFNNIKESLDRAVKAAVAHNQVKVQSEFRTLAQYLMTIPSHEARLLREVILEGLAPPSTQMMPAQPSSRLSAAERAPVKVTYDGHGIPVDPTFDAYYDDTQKYIGRNQARFQHMKTEQDRCLEAIVACKSTAGKAALRELQGILFECRAPLPGRPSKPGVAPGEGPNRIEHLRNKVLMRDNFVSNLDPSREAGLIHQLMTDNDYVEGLLGEIYGLMQTGISYEDAEATSLGRIRTIYSHQMYPEEMSGFDGGPYPAEAAPPPDQYPMHDGVPSMLPAHTGGVGHPQAPMSGSWGDAPYSAEAAPPPVQHPIRGSMPPHVDWAGYLGQSEPKPDPSLVHSAPMPWQGGDANPLTDGEPLERWSNPEDLHDPDDWYPGQTYLDDMASMNDMMARITTLRDGIKTSHFTEKSKAALDGYCRHIHQQYIANGTIPAFARYATTCLGEIEACVGLSPEQQEDIDPTETINRFKIVTGVLKCMDAIEDDFFNEDSIKQMCELYAEKSKAKGWWGRSKPKEEDVFTAIAEEMFAPMEDASWGGDDFMAPESVRDGLATFKDGHPTRMREELEPLKLDPNVDMSGRSATHYYPPEPDWWN